MALSEAQAKKFSAIKARFEDIAQREYVAIKKGDFIRMIWAGVVPEVQWLIAELVKVHGDPGAPDDTAPFPEKKSTKKVKSGRTRLAKVAANKEEDEFVVSNDEGEL